MFFPPSIQTSCATFFYLLKPFVRAHHCAVSASPLAQAPLAQAKLIEPSVRLSVAYR